MTKRTLIDAGAAKIMRVSRPGQDVEADGPPYLFDGSLETLQVHQSGVVEDIFQFGQPDTPFQHRYAGPPGTPAFPAIEVTFPALPYVPHIEWAITSDDLGGALEFPEIQTNKIVGDFNDDLIWLNAAMVPTTSSFKIIATTNNLAAYYELFGGLSERQGDLYYTVFKRPTT